MPTTYIRKTFKKGGVLTSPNAVKLSDRTGAYGVRQQDVPATIPVADGTAMTEVSTGIYEKSFTSIAGKIYEYVVEVQADAGDALNWFADTITADAAAGTVARHTFGELYKNQFAQAVYNTTSPDATQTTEGKRLVNDIYLEVLESHQWSFLSPETTITLWTDIAADDDVTVTSVGTTLTATGGTPFYPSMIGATITIVDDTDYIIAGYTSSSIVILDSAPSATNATFSMTATGRYALPADFGGLLNDFVYVAERSYPPLQNTSPGHIRTLRNVNASSAGEPTWAATEAKAFDQTVGQRWWLWVWSVPSTDTEMRYTYRVNPNEMTSDDEYPIGGPAFQATLRIAVLMAAERFTNQTDGVYHRLFYGDGTDRQLGLLKQAMGRDQDMLPRNLGRMQEHSDDEAAPLPMQEWEYE